MDNRKIKEDYCTDILLKLVSRGSSIIAELLRMKDFIPDVFTNMEEATKFKSVVFDFTYFNKIDSNEDKIRNSSSLRNLDEEFRENYVEILTRFYSVFNNIYKYSEDLNKFSNQLKQGIYVQHSLESLLTGKESRHLICESIFLYGVMLILVDRLLPGIYREKIIVSYYRYSGQTTIENIKEVISLFERTGFLFNTNDRPKQYPVQYLNRVKLDKEFIKMVVGTIKDYDIYDQIAAYPSPEHRSHALSNQASMIFVCLLFLPDYLEHENSKMREIVDKHFSDNWVVSIYLGYTCDVIEYWNEFKAAKNAIKITITEDSVKFMAKSNFDKLLSLTKNVERFYYEGSMNESYVLDNINILLTIMREANVILKWYFLQHNTKNQKYKEILSVKQEYLINLLLATSHFEHNLKTIFQKIIDNKSQMWEDDKQNSLYRLKELSEYFAGLKNFGKQVKQDDFKDFFEKNIKNLTNLNLSNSKIAGRKIVIMKEGLEDIKRYHYIEGNLQIKQYINEIIDYLNHMIRVANIKNIVLINIAYISDFSYAWISIQDYYLVMQSMLKNNSNNILYLKSAFLKLASILNFPLIRLFESNSSDIDSVTNHYSGELVNFVRKVLQIVPYSVFKLLEQIIHIFNKGFKDPPIKILKADIKDYAQLDERYALASIIHKISLFTKGILAMEKTFVGIIEVDPKEILEDGVRKELLSLLSLNFHKILDFSENKTSLENKLRELKFRITSIKKAFFYIQDYINIDASKIWNEELHRLINCFADVEANKFLIKKIKVEEKYNLNKYSIQRHNIPKEENCVSFLGRLFKHIVHISQTKVSIYSINSLSWTSSTTNEELFSLKTLKILKDSMGVEGFQGLFRLISYHIHNKIENVKKSYFDTMTDQSFQKGVVNLSKLLSTPLIFEYTDKDTSKAFLNLISTNTKNLSSLFIPLLISIGQLESIRYLFHHYLKESVEHESNCLYSQMKNINNLILTYERNNERLKFSSIEEQNSNDASSFSFYSLLNEIMHDFSLNSSTFYLDLSKLEHIVILLASLTHQEILNNYNRERNFVVRKGKNTDFSFIYLISGIKVILFQLGRKNALFYYSILCFIQKMTLINQYSLKNYKGLTDSLYEIPDYAFIFDFFIKEIRVFLNITENEASMINGLYLEIS